MSSRTNSWLLGLLAVACAAGIVGFVIWNRQSSVTTLDEILRHLPDRDALTIHVDVKAIREAGMGGLLAGSAVVEEPDYRRFVTESGFDWKTDLDAVTASKAGNDWYIFARGRFDMEKVRNYALSRGGTCRNGVCDVAGSTPGRRISFYPLSSRVLVLASSSSPAAVYNVYSRNGPDWVGGVPKGSAWVSFNGSILAGDPALPSGGRLFGKVLAETQRTTFAVDGVGADGLELRMLAHAADPAAAGRIHEQLELVTSEFRKYFDRLGQKASDSDLSGLLLSGQFSVAGSDVIGRWRLHQDFLKKLAGGEL